MKKVMTVCALASMVATLSSTAGAVTIGFDPDALIQAYPLSAGLDTAGGRKIDQVDARRLHQPWGTVYETFYNPASPKPQPDSYNTYMNWRDSLGTGEGIAMFNSWFLDDSIVKSWGENVVIKPGTTVTGTAADGWNVRVIVNPYGLGGSSVQWWTTDPGKRINTTSAIGNFSITADLYWDLNANGWDASDAPVVAGDLVRFWAGNLNGDDPEFFRSDTQALYFDAAGWGTRSPSAAGPFGAIYSDGAGLQGSGFEAALTATATTPEPGTLVLLGLGLAGLAMRRRKLAA